MTSQRADNFMWRMILIYTVEIKGVFHTSLRINDLQPLNQTACQYLLIR
jgi:hypothetical protein